MPIPCEWILAPPDSLCISSYSLLSGCGQVESVLLPDFLANPFRTNRRNEYQGTNSLALVLGIFAIAAGALTARGTILPIGQFAHASTVAGLRAVARRRRGVVLHELGNVPARAVRAR